MSPDDALARNRFFTIFGARVGGMALAVLGLVGIGGRIEGVPVLAGYPIFLAGLAIMTLLPRTLARRWRTPPAA